MNDQKSVLNITVQELLDAVARLLAEDEISKTEENAVNSQNNSVELKDIRNILLKNNLEMTQDKRTYRKRSDLPDPTQSPDAEVNRLKTQFKMRLENDLLEKLHSKSNKQGVSKQEYVEALIRADLEL